MKYGLSQKQIEEIQSILSKYEEIEKAVVFGSRAIDTFKEASDVDIAIKGVNVTFKTVAKLKYELEEETYIPFFFDVVAYNSIKSNELIEHIDTKGKILYQKGWGEWREVKIGDIANLYQELAINKKTDYLLVDKSSLPLLRIKDLQENTQEIFVNDIEAPKKCIANEDDLIFTRTGIVGLVFMGKKGVVHNNCFRIVPKVDNIHLSFYYYYFNRENMREYLTNISAGSVQPDMNHTIFKTVKVPLPPIEEQKAIAQVLSSLDDKIDLLHRQNKTLEEMAQTLFRQWFIEEADERWEEKPLSGFCIKITKGTTPTTLKKQFVESGINFIKVNCIDDNGNYLEDKFNFIDDETNELLNRSKLESGDILYSIAGTIGRISVVPEDILPANVNQALAIIRINKDKINPNYIRYCLKDKNITFELHSKIVHAVQPNLSLGEISNTLIPFPDETTLNKFSLAVDPLEEKREQNKKQIKTLENMRDTLLPKLVSGEVRVKL
jgi:type I restriction enzyme S subunit